MDILPKNSYVLPEQRFFEIQEVKEIPRKIDSSIEENQNKDVIENVRYISCHDLIMSSATIDREKIFDERPEMIMLEQKQGNGHGRTDNTNRRVIELSDSDSKMVLRRQLGEMAERGNSNLQRNTVGYENMEILRKLPPDTIVIRQKTKFDKENIDYKELTETNTNNSSSIFGCMTVKMKGIPRALRNKTLKTMEVRQNPTRVSKRNIDKDFSRPKQRLLTNSKREIYSDYESGKRIKSSTMPYMNTRSVTRKMYTVGATYQAPTKKDEIEWKEWPVHGMHERPVYHPQAGLAVEYLGRYFTSLDGSSYCEIINEPDIEVVSVDPYCDGRISLTEKKPKGKMRMRSKRSSNTKDAWSTYFSMNDKSFETCMHESLHCVLGYCSQVMTPVYKQAVEEKMTKLTVSAPKMSSLETPKEMTNVKSNVAISSENVAKLAEETKLLEAYAIAIAQSIQNKSITNSTNDQRVASTFPSSSATYVSEAQSVEHNSSKTTPQNGKTIRMNLKQIIRGAPNSSLILLRSAAAKSASGDACTAIAKNIFNSDKLEDTSSDETLGMSSIYKNLVFANEPASKCDESPMSNNSYILKRYATNTQEYTTKKAFLENHLENKKTVQVMKEIHESKHPDKIKINRESDGRMSTTNSSKNLAWCTNETSEIARILSEYNKSTLRKSMIQNQIYGSRDTKTNLRNPSIKNLPKSLWQKNTTAKENQQLISNPNASFDFPQGKWKRFHLMLEKTKNSQIANGNQNTWKNSSTLLENHKVSLRDQQMNLSTLNYVREKHIDSHKDLNEHEIIMLDVKPKEKKSGCSKDETETSKMGSLHELLENTAILYCAANGVHQDDLSDYIDTLDSKQSIQWLESCNNSIM